MVHGASSRGRVSQGTCVHLFLQSIFRTEKGWPNSLTGHVIIGFMGHMQSVMTLTFPLNFLKQPFFVVWGVQKQSKFKPRSMVCGLQHEIQW